MRTQTSPNLTRNKNPSQNKLKTELNLLTLSNSKLTSVICIQIIYILISNIINISL